jgi:hypothetical protein
MRVLEVQNPIHHSNDIRTRNTVTRAPFHKTPIELLTLIQQPAEDWEHLHEGPHQRRREIDHTKETRNRGTYQTAAPKTSKNQSVRSSNKTRPAVVIHLAPPPYEIHEPCLVRHL